MLFFSVKSSCKMETRTSNKPFKIGFFNMSHVLHCLLQINIYIKSS